MEDPSYEKGTYNQRQARRIILWVVFRFSMTSRPAPKFEEEKFGINIFNFPYKH